ncbi:MAG: VWA domain-containing protein [Acidobacteria bacterium]|nr:VWA domain-containing protein [Acidobacteriota bacterium]
MTRLTSAAFAIVGLLLPATVMGQAPPRTEQRKGQDPRIRVEVNLAHILTSVVDQHNRPVPDLPREAFELFEEGVAQKIELFEPETNQPLDLALMVDSSLSTIKELSFEREAAAHFIRQVLRPGDRIAVYQFSENVYRLSDYSSDVLAQQAAVRGIDMGAGTAMFDAIILGSEQLSRLKSGRRRVIVMVTDAGETVSRGSFEDARRAALRSEALLYTILIRPVKNESGRNTAGEHALVTITDSTGGAMYFPDTVADLDAIFDRIDKELRSQYRLGYYPQPQPRPGAFRKVEVRVKGCVGANPETDGNTPPPTGCIVRHRRGYFAAGEM